MINSMTRMILTNAVYFKGTWVVEFDKKNTRDDLFYLTSEATVSTDMMRVSGDEARFNYIKTEDYQAIELDYEGDDLSMIIVLPTKYDLESFEESFSYESLKEIKSGFRKERVNVIMPKFKFNKEYSLKGPLGELGMGLAFTPTADFSGMSEEPLYIDYVIHKSFVDVNEEGTEAAAATVVGMRATSIELTEFMNINHPFIFFIQEKETGNILFMGRVVDPTV